MMNGLNKIFALKLDKGLDEYTLDKLLGSIPYEQAVRIKKFRNLQDKERSLMGIILAKSAICQFTGIKSDEIIFLRNDYGKPYIKNSEDIFFNISHSGEWVVCIIGNSEAGIDVEKINDIDITIFKQVFTASEYNEIMNFNDNEILGKFYGLWTLKESYIKTIGKGLSIPLNSFYFIEKNNEIKVVSQEKNKDFFLRQYNIDEGYKMAACCVGNKLPQDFKIVKYSSLL